MNVCVIFCGYAACVSLVLAEESVNRARTCELKSTGFIVSVFCFSSPNLGNNLTSLSDFDPNLGMMAGITPLNPLMPGLGMVPAPVSQELSLIKEIIHCKSCTLFPPNPSKSYNQVNPPLFTHTIWTSISAPEPLKIFVSLASSRRGSDSVCNLLGCSFAKYQQFHMSITWNKAQRNALKLCLTRNANIKPNDISWWTTSATHILWSLTSGVEHKLLFSFITTLPSNYPELAGELLLLPLSHFRSVAAEKSKSWDFLQISLACHLQGELKQRTPHSSHIWEFYNAATNRTSFFSFFVPSLHRSLVFTVGFSMFCRGKSR